ncbi:MAG: endonuclease III domain-containing protein, partial [Candidatus Syntropharchaeia archaeon]
MDEVEIGEIISRLKDMYGNKRTPVSAERDPFMVLISCILSLRTKDEVTAQASRRLFELARTPEEMLALDLEEIERAIYPVGFYRKKALQIKEISRELVERHASKVPEDLDKLLKLKGVGRKTANIVITVGFGKPGIAVDTHVHRISNRLGLVSAKNPEETELELRKILPKEYWIDLNNL